MLKWVSSLHNELVFIYEEEYDQALKSKDQVRRQRYIYKNLMDLNYQPDQWQQSDQLQQPNQSQQPDQSVPPLVQSEQKFNSTKDKITSTKDNELKTKIDNKQYSFNTKKELIKEIASNEIGNVDVINKLKKNSVDVNKIKEMRRNKNRNNIINLHHLHQGNFSVYLMLLKQMMKQIMKQMMMTIVFHTN